MADIEYLGVNPAGLFRVRVTHSDGYVGDYYFADEIQDELFITKVATERKELMQRSYSKEELAKRGHYK